MRSVHLVHPLSTLSTSLSTLSPLPFRGAGMDRGWTAEQIGGHR